MARPVTLFTGQWADLSLEDLAKKAASWGYVGLELACWGDHFEVDKALEEDGYCESRWEVLNEIGLKCFAISNHLVGQAVCDEIDFRHKAILPPYVWADGNPVGVRKRAAEEMKKTAEVTCCQNRPRQLWHHQGIGDHRPLLHYWPKGSGYSIE